MFRDPRLTRIAAFLRSIGIPMRPGAVDVPTLFPGSLIDRGSLVIDESKLVAPGDALHEAAHIALAPPERRALDFAFMNDATGGEELTTIAWCWAALLEIDIEPEDIFHGTAYKGGDSSTIIDAARKGQIHRLPSAADVGDGVRREERAAARRRSVSAHGEVETGKWLVVSG